VEGLEAGADDFLAKPFNEAELRLRVRAGQRILLLRKQLLEQNRLLEASNLKMSKELMSAARESFSSMSPATAWPRPCSPSLFRA
jgi:sigma-B regulation protein RsbU (phosphoserine phosphatase)